MLKLFYRFSAIVLLSIGLSAASGEANKVFQNSVFTLNAGQRVTIEGERLVIKFNTVYEDSRCPVNAACVWAGNGQVEFEVIDSDGQNKTVILNTEDEPKTVVLKNHLLKLIALNPPRTDGLAILPKDYKVTVLVEKKSSDKNNR